MGANRQTRHNPSHQEAGMTKELEAHDDFMTRAQQYAERAEGMLDHNGYSDEMVQAAASIAHVYATMAHAAAVADLARSGIPIFSG